MEPQFYISGHCHKDQRVCFGIAWTPAAVLLRDTKLVDSPVLHISPREWGWFVRGAKDGQSDYGDLPVQLEAPVVRGLALVLTRNLDGGVRATGVTADGVCTSLMFTEAELTALLDGVRDGQFDSADSPGRLPMPTA